ncbi:hypothetical protein FRB91_002281 [Serendipita sp. 411]|nr:hypothetical protein FRB91_002281 [Serendipita sp. 411]
MAHHRTDLRYSEEFPPGYGDIQLITRDRIVFHFHPWPLAHMSPIFRDMFRIEDAHRGSSTPSFTLPESSATISMILSFIDPIKDNPTLDFPILPQLLEAERKYQISKIKDWMIRWLNTRSVMAETTDAELDTQLAIELLEAGPTFDIPLLSQLALRVLIKAPASEILVPGLAGSKMFGHLMKLGAKRIDWFRQALIGLLCGGAAPRRIHHGEFTIDDEVYRNICAAMIELTHAVCLEPSYACCERNWGDLHNVDYINGIEIKKKSFQGLCKSLEAELPGLS